MDFFSVDTVDPGLLPTSDQLAILLYKVDQHELCSYSNEFSNHLFS